MNELCGMDCCGKCSLNGNACEGCAQTNGHPCGGSCVAAECVKNGGIEALAAQKKALMDEINALNIKELQVADLCLLNGSYVNLTYELPNGGQIKLLRDDRVYWGWQVERPGNERCYGIAADDRYLLICEYGCEGADPEIILYKKR